MRTAVYGSEYNLIVHKLVYIFMLVFAGLRFWGTNRKIRAMRLSDFSNLNPLAFNFFWGERCSRENTPILPDNDDEVCN